MHASTGAWASEVLKRTGGHDGVLGAEHVCWNTVQKGTLFRSRRLGLCFLSGVNQTCVNCSERGRHHPSAYRYVHVSTYASFWANNDD